MPKALAFIEGKKVIVTGGVGSVGSELVKLMLESDVSLVRIIDNNESALFNIGQTYGGDNRVEFYHCDICDVSEMERTFGNMDLCFHTAGLKHVPSCEKSPFSTVRTNILGSEIVMRAALTNKLEKVLFTSTDKAVNPTNVMGTSKLMTERLFTAMNFLNTNADRTIFSSVRFGNVAGSRGSVIPIFFDQIRKGGPVTLTDSSMTRFIMTLGDAAKLVVQSMAFAKGGELFITKMPTLRIEDLAEVMIELLAPIFGHDPNAIEIKVVGLRAGEKLWEELSTSEECNRLLESENYLVVLPAIASEKVRSTYIYDELPTRRASKMYISSEEPCMSKTQIHAFLMRPDVLPAEIISHFSVEKTAN